MPKPPITDEELNAIQLRADACYPVMSNDVTRLIKEIQQLKAVLEALNEKEGK